MNEEKQHVIDQINRFIELNGSFTTADVEASSSPLIGSANKDQCILAERFYKGYCFGMEYVHGHDIGGFDYDYEELELDTLYDILVLAEQWDVICYKTQKRCSN
jgi:hypothetical protein